jgi:hypothetical protein
MKKRKIKWGLLYYMCVFDNESNFGIKETNSNRERTVYVTES